MSDSAHEPMNPDDIDWDREIELVRAARTRGRCCSWCRRSVDPRATYCPSCRRFIGPGEGTPEASEAASTAASNRKGAIWTAAALFALLVGCSAWMSKLDRDAERDVIRSRRLPPADSLKAEFWDPNNPGIPARRIRPEHIREYSVWRKSVGR